MTSQLPAYKSSLPEYRDVETKPARASRRKRAASVDPEAAIRLMAGVARMIGRKFEVLDVEGDVDAYNAADAYLTFYQQDIAAGTRRNFDFLDSMASARSRFKGLTDGQVKGVLNCLRADVVRQDALDAEAAAGPVARPVKREAITQDGMYKLGETIYKVQKAVHGSGKLYAKRLVVDTSVQPAHVSFEYEAGAVSRLSASDKLTLEEAKAFGALYGTCCVCGRTLTDETSIAEGIGPICARRF